MTMAKKAQRYFAEVKAKILSSLVTHSAGEQKKATPGLNL